MWQYPHVRWCSTLAANLTRRGAANSIVDGRCTTPVYVALIMGSRQGVAARVVEDRLDDLAEQVLKGLGALLVVRHGAARGADTRAGSWARASGDSGWRIVEDPYPVSPLDWKVSGRGAGHLRNQRMVDAEPRPDTYLAFARPGGSAGTADCVRRAEAAGIPDALTWLGRP